METVKIDYPRMKARELFREYRKHQHYSQPIDREIQRTLQLIAQGRVVIKALDSIKAAGLGDDGLPKLAICRADAEHCWCNVDENGSAIFSMVQLRWRAPGNRQCIRMPAKTFAVPKVNPAVSWMARKSGRAMMPLIPIHLRPKRGLQNYHVLFEPEWTPVPPVDPILLRRIGRGDLWLVCGAWDLSEIERAALAARVSA